MTNTMGWVSWTLIFVLGTWTALVRSQEIPAENNVDEAFQTVFFDALQQKAMGNSDRAAMLFLEAKELKPESAAVHHELARAYILENRLESARDHAIKALAGEASEYWYLSTLMEVLEQSQMSLSTIESELPFDSSKFRINLSRWYIENVQPQEAMHQLAALEPSVEIRKLKLIANEMILVHSLPAASIASQTDAQDNVQEKIRTLTEWIEHEDWNNAYLMASEAMEEFPLQPFFYFITARAKWAMGKKHEALELLESGEFYLLEDDALSPEYYELFAEIHLELGNESAYQTYLKKIH